MMGEKDKWIKAEDQSLINHWCISTSVGERIRKWERTTDEKSSKIMLEKLWRGEVMRQRGRKRKSEVELEKGVRQQWPVQAKFVNKSVEQGLPFFRVASLNYRVALWTVSSFMEGNIQCLACHTLFSPSFTSRGIVFVLWKSSFSCKILCSALSLVPDKELKQAVSD